MTRRIDGGRGLELLPLREVYPILLRRNENRRDRRDRRGGHLRDVLLIDSSIPKQEDEMVQALWKGALIAESDGCVVVEGNQYFPLDAVHPANLKPSSTTSHCPWKGTAHYYDVVVGADVNKDAAWYYPAPKPAAAEIKDRVAFWKGVEVRA